MKARGLIEKIHKRETFFFWHIPDLKAITKPWGKLYFSLVVRIFIELYMARNSQTYARNKFQVQQEGEPMEEFLNNHKLISQT